MTGDQISFCHSRLFFACSLLVASARESAMVIDATHDTLVYTFTRRRIFCRTKLAMKLTPLCVARIRSHAFFFLYWPLFNADVAAMYFHRQWIKSDIKRFSRLHYTIDEKFVYSKHVLQSSFTIISVVRRYDKEFFKFFKNASLSFGHEGSIIRINYGL